MRVVIQRGNDVDDYIRFIEEVTKTKFYEKTDYSNFYFRTFYSNKDVNYILIRGENVCVSFLIRNNLFYEKNIIIVSCTPRLIFFHSNYNFYKSKNILLPKYSEDGEYLTKYDGVKYDLLFNPCKAEIKIYRDKNRLEFKENLLKHFYRTKLDDIQNLRG